MTGVIAPVHGGTDDLAAPRLDLSTNANPHGPSPVVLAGLAGVDVGPYPEPSHRVLRERLADHLGVDPGRLVLGTGASELVHRVVRHLGGPVLVRRATFGEYAHAARTAGLPLVQAADEASLLHALPDAGCTILCSPDNPTGHVTDDATFQQVGRDRTGGVVVDLAYAPLHDGPVPAPAWAWHLHAPNKAHGATGIRAGVLVAPDTAGAAAVRASGASWPLGAHAVAFLRATTQPGAAEWLATTRARLWRDRERLTAELRRHGATVHDTGTTFVRLEVDDAARFADAVRRDHGVKVRDATSFGLDHQVRVAVPRTEDLDLAIEALLAAGRWST